MEYARTDVLDVGFDAVTLQQAVERAMDALSLDGPAQYVVTPNPEIVWECRKDEALRRTLENALLVLPDGVGVIYGSRILGRPLPEKVAGCDFAEALAGRLAESGKSLFLLGSKPGVAELAADALRKKYPALRIAGTADGYFRDDGPVIEQVNRSGADVLFVCLGAPKQEKWMAANRDKLCVRLMAGLGGTLDVFAGTVRRAPAAWQKLGLEWLYRLLREPKRIKRQIRLPLFLTAVIGRRIRGK
jgi:N-acetylglucosaminyldiphosphoundecaprenol N-acetyl-beta-D-mannosaminyltransferase